MLSFRQYLDERNYEQEAAWAHRPENLKRHAARNRARYAAVKAGKVHKGDGKEMDHVGYHPLGSLDDVKARAVSRDANRHRQPPHKAKWYHDHTL